MRFKTENNILNVKYKSFNKSASSQARIWSVQIAFMMGCNDVQSMLSRFKFIERLC